MEAYNFLPIGEVATGSPCIPELTKALTGPGRFSPSSHHPSAPEGRFFGGVSLLCRGDLGTSADCVRSDRRHRKDLRFFDEETPSSTGFR